MNLSLYIAGDSIIHRASVGLKFLLLIVFSSAVFIYEHLWFSTLLLILSLALFGLAKISLKTVWEQIRPILLFLIVIFIFQWYFESLIFAVNVIVRLSAVILLASLVTLTTKSSAMIESIEKNFSWLRVVGINPEKLGLAIALVLRFIPVMFGIMQKIREAQKVRGLEGSIFALAIPIIIRTLRMADDISSAIDARAFDSQK